MFNKNEAKIKTPMLYVFSALIPIVSILMLFVLWLTAAKATKGTIVPFPEVVLIRLIELVSKPINKVSLSGHIWASLKRVFTAEFFALIIGIPFGVIIGWNKFARGSLGTLFEMLRPIPAIAWMPLLVMWMGIGETSKVVMVFIGAVMPVVVNSYTGIKMVNDLDLDVGRMFNASTDKKLLMQIAIPAALPAIFAGIRNATSLGWMVVLAAEMMGAKSGLGFLILRGMESFDVPLIMCGMLMIGIVGALLGIATNYFERWVCPWNRSLISD